jgi:hypothetical protein
MPEHRASTRAEPGPFVAAETSPDRRPRSDTGPEGFIGSYRLARICALQEEYRAACKMLDVSHFPTPQGMEAIANDENTYVFGKLEDHYVVLGWLPRGRMGIVNTPNVARDIIRSFPT